jgi:hypothetical protein
MTLPELIANSPVPGTVTALTTLKVELKTGAKELEVAAPAPAALHAEGQFRIVLGSEILLIEGPSAATAKWKVLERAAEGSTEASHAAGASVYNILTAAALRSALVANSPIINGSSILMAFGEYNAETGYPFTKEPANKPVTPVNVGAVVDESTAKNYFLISSQVENAKGTTPTVALFGQGIGQLAWGANILGFTRGENQRVTGVEVDFGHLTEDPKTEPETGAIAYGLTIQYFPHQFQAENSAPYIQVGLKKNEHEEAKNLGCKYGLRFLGNPPGKGGNQAALIGPEGVVIDFHNVTSETGSCMIGINLSSNEPGASAIENNKFSEAAIRFGDGHNIMFGKETGSKIGKEASEKIGFWGATPIVRPKVTGSRSSGAALTSLLEQLADAGLIVNESST